MNATGVPAPDGAPQRPAKPGYTIVAASAADDSAILLTLWDAGLARDGLARAKLQWYYVRNPEGPPRILLLRDDASGRAVGVAAMGRRRMRRGAESLVAGFIMDFVVEPEHRSFFPALRLQKELLRRGLEEHALAFAMPNALSEAVVRRAGYRRVGRTMRLVRVLRSRAYLSRFVPGGLAAVLGAAFDHALLAAASLRAPRNPHYAWEWRDRPGADFDALWARVAPCGALIGVRDGAYLTWRFVESPFDSYRFFTLASKADRKLVAYAACRVHEQHLHVADFLVDPAAPDAGKRLWLELSREAYRHGHRSLSVEYFGSEAVRRELDVIGVLDRGGRPVYAAVDGHHELSDAARWFVTHADEDG
jgi:hypothetical protein